MTIKEYMALNGDIFMTSNPIFNGIFTTEHRTMINRMLKFDYGSKEMVYSEKDDVDDIVEMLLFENRFKYRNSSNLVSYELPSDYTEQFVETGTRLNTGTQSESGTVIKDNTGTVGVVANDSKANTGTQTIADTGTVILDGSGTATTQPNDMTKSQLGFDGGALVANEKTAQSIIENASTVDNTTTNNLLNTRTDLLNEKVDRTQTTTEDLNELVDHEKTRTDNLSESLNNTKKHIIVNDKVDLMIKMRQASGDIRVLEVAVDIVDRHSIRRY